MQAQLERYYKRYSDYPTSVIGEPIYGSRENRHDLQEQGSRFSQLPSGRPRQLTAAHQEALKRAFAPGQSAYLQRLPIADKFGQAKNDYALNYIRAKRADSSAASINSIFLVMKLLIPLAVFFVLKIEGYQGR